MPEKIELRYPEQKIEENRRLRAPVPRFEYEERVPVIFGVGTRFVLHERGVGFLEYFSDPKTHLRHQLLNQKWKLENMPGDWVTGKGVSVSPDFQHAPQAGSFEVEVDWRDDVPPKVTPPIQNPEDVESLEVPDVRAGMFGRVVEWYEDMCDAANEFEVTFNGDRVPVGVSFGVAGAPFPKAMALAQTNLLQWTAECPEAVHHLMDRVTESHIRCERYRRERLGLPMKNTGGGCDGGEMLSPDMFREFVSPYHLRLYEAFPGSRGLHMCGRIDHLLEILAVEWRINSLTGFGDCTDKHQLAAAMGGHVTMNGGVDINVLLRGTPSEVKAEALRNLDVFAPCRGYMLCDGYNLPPGTPIENLEAMVEASIEYGRPPD
ncbi:MAG: uroporphyrinogen decarboxylase family protein [Planctomycetota bacterium]|jgi:uroporphyrinogen-III decarboxylase|nr:uroporphyrinogen decarboxylase family protein [Planctomycetota bacterium]